MLAGLIKTELRRVAAMLLALPGLLLSGLLLAAGECPQPRHTATAPQDFLDLQNPLAAGFDRRQARRLFESEDTNMGCHFCHGRKGEGNGALAVRFALPPRNFSCAATMKDIPDGQLFWVIREGSSGTAMPAHPQLSDGDVWLLVNYVKSMAR